MNKSGKLQLLPKKKGPELRKAHVYCCRSEHEAILQTNTPKVFLVVLYTY